MDDTEKNQVFENVHRFLMAGPLKTLPLQEREDVASDIVLDLLRYDYPSHDPTQAPLEPYLINAAKREARRRIGPSIQKRQRRRALETEAARERERRDTPPCRSRHVCDPLPVDLELDNLDDLDIPLNRGRHRRLLEIMLKHPDLPYIEQGRMAGYPDKSNAHRAKKALIQKLRGATDN